MKQFRHGGEIYALARQVNKNPEDLLDLSSNINIFAQELTENLIKTTPNVFWHYPDSEAAALKNALAKFHNYDPACFLIGNGATELIWHTLRSLAPRKVLCLGPIFSEYAAACAALNITCQIITPPEEENFNPTDEEYRQVQESDADMLVLCTPNNPGAVCYQHIGSLLQSARPPHILIDNCYRDFLADSPAYAHNSYAAYSQALKPGTELLSLQSFTKFFCCPGIRLGYLMGRPQVIKRLNRHRPSWMVSPFALLLGEQFLKHFDAYQETLRPLAKARMHLALELRRLPCFEADQVFEGSAFVLAKLQKNIQTGPLCLTLLHSGLIVRNCDPIPGMPPGYIRIGIKDSFALLRLLDALATLPKS